MPQHDGRVAVLGVDPKIVLVGQRFARPGVDAVRPEDGRLTVGRPRCGAIRSQQPTLGGSEAHGVARVGPFAQRMKGIIG